MGGVLREADGERTASDAEAQLSDALSYARESMASFSRNTTFLSVALVRAGFERAEFINGKLAHTLDRTNISASVLRALRGSEFDRAALFALAANLGERGAEMPRDLVFWLREMPRAMGTPRRSGIGKPRDRTDRRLVIGFTVAVLVQSFKIAATRNRATFERDSACSIVAQASAEAGFPISEAGVEKIWREYR
jgi:hypothetical protein